MGTSWLIQGVFIEQQQHLGDDLMFTVMVEAASCFHVNIDGADEVLDCAFVVVGHQLLRDLWQRKRPWRLVGSGYSIR